MKSNHFEPIIVYETFHQDVKTVWKYLVEIQHMHEWYFENLPDFKAEEGFVTSFPVSSEQRTFTHIWKVVEVIPFEKIKLSWTYKEYSGEGFVTFQLEEKNSGTKLTVITEGLETFPQNIPEFQRESCEGGWNYFIKDRLKNYATK